MENKLLLQKSSYSTELKQFDSSAEEAAFKVEFVKTFY